MYRPSSLSLILICVIAALGTWLAIRDAQTSPAPVGPIHFHAAFEVYRAGVKMDFSDPKFMHIEPCVENENTAFDPEDDLAERAHLHDGIGNIVHVHRPNVTWRALFENINYQLPDDAQGYSAGTFVDRMLDQKIQPYERVLIFTDELRDPAVKYVELPDKARIEVVEAQSENCGATQ